MTLTGVNMKPFKLFVLAIAFLSIVNCAVVPEADTEPTGSIAFGVFSLTLAKNPGSHGQGLAVTIFVKHDESGVIHEVNIPFKPGTRIEYLDNLEPGHYTITEYQTDYGFSRPFNTAVKSGLQVEVVANQAVLFSEEVSMSEIYPSAGLTTMDDKAYWQSLIKR